MPSPLTYDPMSDSNQRARIMSKDSKGNLRAQSLPEQLFVMHKSGEIKE